MRGERCTALTLDAHGVVGDRRFAFRSTAAPLGKPMLHSRERTRLLLYSARLVGNEVFVTTPTVETFPLRSGQLLAHLQRHVAEPGSTLTLVHSDRPQTDVRPVALSTSAELATLNRLHPADPRRFRANIVLNAAPLPSATLVTASTGAALRTLEPIPRCRVVSLDPDTAEADPSLLRHLARHHAGCFGTYALVTQPGSLTEAAQMTLAPDLTV